MDIQTERRRLLDAEGGDGDPAGLMSEQDAYLSKVNNRKLYLATFASVLGPMSFGFVLGYSSPAIPELTRIADPRLRLDDVQASWFGSIVTVGAAAGGLLGGWMVEKIGRKLSLMFCSLPFVFGFTIIIAAQNVWMLHAGRALTGLASGVTSLVVPLYISEMAHERVRGTLGSCVQLMVVLGIMGVYLAGLFLDWRWLAICSSIPPTLLMVCMCFMPETPRFLLSQGKRREAEEALRFLRGPDAPVEWECARIEEACDEQGSSFQMSDLKDPGVYKPLVIGIMLMIFQQMTGINAIMFYAETIFEQAHFKESDLASVIVGLIQVVFTGVAAMIMDKAGRKVLLIISGVAMAISTTAFGVYFYLTSKLHTPPSLSLLMLDVMNEAGEEPHADLAWLALVSMAVFITGFALGWGPIPWLVMSEIFPTKVRGVASAVCVLTNWSMAFIVTKTFQDMMSLLTSAGTFWLFASMCIINVIFTIALLPETKGKTLEQIEATFRGTSVFCKVNGSCSSATYEVDVRSSSSPIHEVNASHSTATVPPQLNPDDTTGMSDIARYFVRRELVSSGLTQFNDRPENYWAWKSSYINATRELNLNASEELDLLTKWLGRESSEHIRRIRSVHVATPAVGLQLVWERLEECYGSPEVIERALFERLENFPKVSNKDPMKLRELGDLLTELNSAKSEGYLPGLSYLDTARGVNPIVEKLPHSLQEKWLAKGSQYKEQHCVSFPPFAYFTDFICGDLRDHGCNQLKFSRDEESCFCGGEAVLLCFVSGRPEGSSLYQLWTLVLQTVHQPHTGTSLLHQETPPVPSVEKDPEPELDCRQPVRPPVYKEVLDEHKISLRRRCEHVTEGSDEAGSETLLNRIYTELYITEGQSEEVNTQHEVRQLETASKMKTLHDTPIKCHNIFKALPDQQKHIRVVVTSGVAGVGKTFSVQKFTLDWAEGLENQDVSLLILLSFRELNLIKDEQYSLLMLLHVFHPTLQKVTAEQLAVCKLLFIFDGLDESRLSVDFYNSEVMSDVTQKSSVNVLLTNLIKGNLLPSALIWITSRPAAASINQIPPECVDRVTEVRGFTDAQKDEEYFRRRSSAGSAATVLDHMLTTDQRGELPKTLTDLYSHFLLVQTKRKKQKYDEGHEMSPQELIEADRKLLLKLGRLAFEHLEKGKHHVLPRRPGAVWSGCHRGLGVLRSLYRDLQKRECVIFQKTVYCFVHLSIQEFLAAVYYMFHCYTNRNTKVLEDFLGKDLKYKNSDPSLDDLLKGVMEKSLKSKNGHLDLFVRFLHGLSLESNQRDF
ncbi:hypothetical protein L3Q82_006974 [Scortum barcoo]|uniref:Uncharacterized protein n=1 Tax=Scortum barcoo TaxID=214431 RepID=A0ACB8WWM5_9TELE|nr:hypothetical protein L3Q82_006974 [Scortum barcoo]